MAEVPRPNSPTYRQSLQPLAIKDEEKHLIA
jgi:hypothetical protein